MRLLYYININNIMSCNNNECSSNTYSNSKIYEPTGIGCLNFYPIISIATLYNYYQNCGENECSTNNIINKGNKIMLNIIDLAEDEFFNMFYYTSAKYFCVNKANTTNRSIILGTQTYVNNDSRINKLSLYNEVIKSFEQNYNVSANNINPAALISLQREVYNTQSLASICGSQLGLSWEQVVANLISCDYIERSCNNSVAIIIFQVNLNYHSCALNVDLIITFQYKVPIFGYILKNVPPPYSNAEEVFFSDQYSNAEEICPASVSEECDYEEDSNLKEEGSNYVKKNKSHAKTYSEDSSLKQPRPKYIKISKTQPTKNPTIKQPRYNIQSLANKLKDIEELILDANDEEFEFSDNESKHSDNESKHSDNESKHNNSDSDDNDDFYSE